MSKSKRLVFFGTEDFSVPALKSLLSEGWNIVAVITKPDYKAGRGQRLKQPPVKDAATEAGIKVLQPAKLIDIYKQLTALGAEGGILVSYGKIIPQKILDIFPSGIINVHPSLLPKYRGPSPIEAAILNGDKETGISLMKLSAGMDEGPVYAQEVVTLTGNEDRLTLSTRLSHKGAVLLTSHLEEILNGRLEPATQNDSKATYTQLLTKEDGNVSWDEPADIIERKVRAFVGFPKSRAKILGQNVIITRARVAKAGGDGSLVMKCLNSWLEVQELIAPSGRNITGAEFLRGYAKK